MTWISGFTRLGCSILILSAAAAAGGATTVEWRTGTSSNDAEESSASISLSSSVLDLSSSQMVGLRWSGAAIPRAATITAAYIQFSAAKSQQQATSLAIRGQASDDAPAFRAATGDISTRPRTGATVGWTPPGWKAGKTGAEQRTPDLSPL